MWQEMTMIRYLLERFRREFICRREVRSRRCPILPKSYLMSRSHWMRSYSMERISTSEPVWLAIRLEEKDCPMLSRLDRKSTRLNSSHVAISYAVFCLKQKIDTTSTRLY